MIKNIVTKGFHGLWSFVPILAFILDNNIYIGKGNKQKFLQVIKCDLYAY